ncbi:DUF1835 domain-containing protein [Pararobbsia silviterrae]|nr:DUF1835 domain-containing protein [Pararobbsia silviterrae]
MRYLHVVNGDCAAQVLARALSVAGRDDEVVCLRDDLAIGPIDQIDDAPHARASFWQNVLASDDAALASAFDTEVASIQALARSEFEVVVWHGRSAGDQLALRRVAFHLRSMPDRFNEVGLTLQELDPSSVGPGGQTAVALYSTDILRARLPTIAPVSMLRMSRLALEWQELKRVSSEVRHLSTHTIVGGSFCDIDAQIIERLDPVWQALPPFVRSIMDAHTGFYATDTLIDWRIRELVSMGTVAIRGDGQTREICRMHISVDSE